MEQGYNGAATMLEKVKSFDHSEFKMKLEKHNEQKNQNWRYFCGRIFQEQEILKVSVCYGRNLLDVGKYADAKM